MSLLPVLVPGHSCTSVKIDNLLSQPEGVKFKGYGGSSFRNKSTWTALRTCMCRARTLSMLPSGQNAEAIEGDLHLKLSLIESYMTRNRHFHRCLLCHVLLVRDSFIHV